MKHCNIRNHWVDESEFYPSKKSPDKLLAGCKECRKAHAKDKYYKYSDKYKKKVLRDKFQIASFHAMYKAAKIGGKNNYEAFVAGICGSCDTIVDKLPVGSIQQWADYRASEKIRRKGLAVNQLRREDRKNQKRAKL